VVCSQSEMQMRGGDEEFIEELRHRRDALITPRSAALELRRRGVASFLR